jgi:predicted DNA-binding transcriptional regulator YafY
MRKNIKEDVFRQLGIISYLYENEEAKISELSEVFGVSESVVIEDLKILQVAGDTNDMYLNQKLISFNPDWLDDGWVELYGSFGMESVISLGNLEVSLLIATLNMLSASIDNEELKALVNKLKAVSTGSDIISGQPVIANGDFIYTTLDTATNRNLISFVYSDKLREFFPLQFRIYANKYYIYGFDVESSSYKLYNPQKMHDLKILDKKLELHQLDNGVISTLCVELVLDKKHQYLIDQVPIISSYYTKSEDFAALLGVGNIDWFKEFLYENAFAIKELRVLEKDKEQVDEIIELVKNRCK